MSPQELQSPVWLPLSAGLLAVFLTALHLGTGFARGFTAWTLFWVSFWAVLAIYFSRAAVHARKSSKRSEL
jgi:hypothetical protein